MGHSGTETPDPVLCCPGCRYELRGLPAGACPECGRWFDPTDPSTVWDLAARKRAARRARVRVGVLALAVLAVMQLCVMTVIPRPAIAPFGGVQWGLWVWLGRGYGVQREHLNTETLLVHRWGTRVNRIESKDRWASGVPATRWSLTRKGPDRWRMEAVSPDVRWQALLLGFNTMRDDEELFGVRITGAAREEAECPFVVEGSRVDVLAEMIRVYGLEIEPGLTSETDADVWVVLPGTGELAEVSVERAGELGYRVSPFQTDAVMRIEVATDTGLVERAADMLRTWRGRQTNPRPVGP